MGIKRVLIANRGEIALRAIRSLKESGKEAVAVYSTGDKDASYLNIADVKVCIGGVKAKDSYLNIPAIITAAELSECDAIFPGYGFLSENPHFVEVCEHHGLKFIGPNAKTISLMGNKSKAKETMIKAGVPVVPGTAKPLDSVDEAKKVAKEIGYPVILKASSGGGGRGMRIVENEANVEKAFLSAESEAIAAFGDGAIYIEKFIDSPRHVEVQILGDSHGNVVHLGDRDCSLQRRHQKLIEESLSTFISEKTREKLYKTTIEAAKFIGYEGAGTIEYLVDKDENFYFMEMNTRLQVEHPVTEMVTGVDIVDWMVKIAEGEKLFAQEDVKFSGHSIECRITAEDPKRFMPSAGEITKMIAPGGMHVRFDSHAYGGYFVPPYYDSMIGKLIVWGVDRDDAINRMKRALDEFSIEGIKTVIPFHKEMMRNDDYICNRIDTRYLERFLSKG
jgi:acetyl-CoA carboxylase biotin carboxylase subunit